MSIETDLGRIAAALESIVKMYGVQPPAAAVAQQVEPKKTAKKVEPKVETPEVDPFEQPEEKTAPEVTLEMLSEVLKSHAKALGTKVTIALIQKHGADEVTPKINTIPTANYSACFAEATADLKKVKA